MGEPQLPGQEEHFSQRKQHVQRASGRRKIGTLVDLEGHVCGQSKVNKTENLAKGLWRETLGRITQGSDACTPKFTASLSAVARTWRQPRCLSTEEWRENMWCVCAVEYYSAMEGNGIMPSVATWMDLEIVILGGVGRTKKDKYHVMSLICGT